MTKAADPLVLVVDDEPNVREYLKSVLEDAGFRVAVAGDGEEAMRLIRKQRPDFISLDLIMPRKSGHRLLFELKRDPKLARIPVLIVTAHARDDLGHREFQDLLDQRVMSGPGTYLEKPVNPATYVAAVRRALGLPEAAAADDRPELKARIREGLQSASPEALRRALAALRQRGS